MNEAQKAAIRRRQMQQVGAQTQQVSAGVEPEPERPAVELEPFAAMAARLRPDVGEGVPVAFLRFVDKTTQLRGMSSGDAYTARTEPNGREHVIELVKVGGATCFLVTFADPARRELVYEFVERSAVKTWRMA
jgi:hypothetical protein